MTYTDKEIASLYVAETPLVTGPTERDNDRDSSRRRHSEDERGAQLSRFPALHAAEIDGVKWTDVTKKVMQAIYDRGFESPVVARAMRARSIETSYHSKDYDTK